MLRRAKFEGDAPRSKRKKPTKLYPIKRFIMGIDLGSSTCNSSVCLIDSDNMENIIYGILLPSGRKADDSLYEFMLVLEEFIEECNRTVVGFDPSEVLCFLERPYVMKFQKDGREFSNINVARTLYLLEGIVRMVGIKHGYAVQTIACAEVNSATNMGRLSVGDRKRQIIDTVTQIRKSWNRRMEKNLSQDTYDSIVVAYAGIKITHPHLSLYGNSDKYINKP